MHGIGCQKVLLPQHQSTVSKHVMTDLFASHQKIHSYKDLYLMMMKILYSPLLSISWLTIGTRLCIFGLYDT